MCDVDSERIKLNPKKFAEVAISMFLVWRTISDRDVKA